jgi:hypothetical protein
MQLCKISKGTMGKSIENGKKVPGSDKVRGVDRENQAKGV